MSIKEARGFADAIRDYADGLRCTGDTFHADVFDKANEVINSLCDTVEAMAKEKGGKKEIFPPAPPIEKKGGKEKTTTTTARACAERKFSPPSREDVYNFAKSQDIDLRFADYWYNVMETNYNPPWYNSVKGCFFSSWRKSLIAYWTRADRDEVWKKYLAKRIAKEAIKRRVTKPEDWDLCKERCAKFNAKYCRCDAGYDCPADKREHPIAPEECYRYKAKK